MLHHLILTTFFSTDDDIDDDLALEELQNNKLNKKNTTPGISNKLYKEKGLAYTRPNGVKVAARKCGAPCSCLKLNCSFKYKEEVRMKLLRNFLNLSSSAQNQFLANHVSISFVAESKV